MKPPLIFTLLLLLGTACRRPSTQIGATLTPSKDSTRTAPLPASEMTNFAPYLKAGDEFMAIGNEPSWSMSINPSKNYLRFKTLTGDSLTVEMPQRIIDSNGRIRFQAETPGGELTALFRLDSCVNASGQQYDYRVDVSYNGKTYAGCGASLQQLSLLNDSWVLETLNGDTIPKTAGRGGPPSLTFQLAEGRVMGSTGCNRLTGSVFADTRQVRFVGFATTRMACAGDAGRVEGDFLEALNPLLTYRVGNGILTLLHDSKPIMTFRKTD